MRSVFLAQIDNNRVTLDPQEQHHLTRVLRKQPGYEFIGLDGKGARYHCRLDREGRAWFGEILEVLEIRGESPLDLHLVQALIKKDRFEWVLQKCVELGVSRITPLSTWRTEVDLNETRVLKKYSRWERILLEAVKQSRRSRIPRLDVPVELADFLQKPQAESILAMDEEGNLGLREFLDNAGTVTSLALLIGPEGGWDPRERELFEQNGVPRVQLGPRTLRTETAAVTAVSLVQYALGDL